MSVFRGVFPRLLRETGLFITVDYDWNKGGSFMND
jgi:hypothetical protein